MSALNHPCIASLFQTMQVADNVYYLVTELVSGGDLCSFISGQRYGKLEERLARVYARQFASALAHMHSYGIVHRDLKMENVMMNSTQTLIKIVDFGLSNVWSAVSPLRTHCGSPEYAAPELFIARKNYGPEVDLWSLGIILFGMVVGQLPFVGGRKNQLPSQERRKKLVAQINKGLGTTQRQAIAPLSPEFRTMLNKLLTADPAKRISSKELLVHPWITEKGRKFVQTHPFKQLDNEAQTKLMKQLTDIFQVDEDTVTAVICKNRYGRLGGMYNMLTYKEYNETFHPDHISLTMVRNKTELHSTKTQSRPKSASLAKSQHTLYNQCIVLLNKVSKQQLENRAKSANPALVFSKNVTQSSQSKTVYAGTKTHSTKPNNKTNSIVINRKIEESFLPTLVSHKRTASSKLQINDNKVSWTCDKRRPQTTETTRGILKPPRRSSASAGIPSTTYKQNIREIQRRLVCLNPEAMGDGNYQKQGPSSAPLRNVRAKDRLANEPIARSIAGYLIKNVPDYMFNLQMMQK